MYYGAPMRDRVATRLTQKYQTTVPRKVRELLGLQKGDVVVFELTDSGVSIVRAVPTDLEYLAALETTLSEWSSEADDEAFRDL